MNNKSLDDIKIDQSKFKADGQKYFGLFEKHIPRNLGGESNVLLYSLNNEDCIMNIVALNPEARYFVYDHEHLKYLREISPQTRFVFMHDDGSDKVGAFKNMFCQLSSKYNIDMKFDCVIMNPPYQHGLYTDIFAESEKHLAENGKCVCLSPVNRYAAQIKKGNNNLIAKHKAPVYIDDVFLIKESDANKIFNIALSEDLAIFCYMNSSVDKLPCDLTKMIVDYDLYSFMMSKNITTFKSQFESKPKEFSLRYGTVPVKNSGTKFGFGCTSYANACKQHITGNMAFINFNSSNEQYNCWKSGWTNFIRFCAKVDSNIVPFMKDAIHPKTGLKGYASEWTDNDYFEYFQFPQNLKDKILNFMKPHNRVRINDEYVLKK